MAEAKTARQTRIFHKEVRKTGLWRLITGSDFSPRACKRIIQGLAKKVIKYSPEGVKAKYYGDNCLTFAALESEDNILAGKIRYIPPWMPLDARFGGNTSAMIEMDITLASENPQDLRKYDGLAAIIEKM